MGAGVTRPYPVDAVGVADGGDGFGLRVGQLDGGGAEGRAAGAHAAVGAAGVLVLVRRASRLDLQAGPLHGVVDAAGKFAVAATAAHQGDGKRGAVLAVPATEATHQGGGPGRGGGGPDPPAGHLPGVHPDRHLLGETQIFEAYRAPPAGLLEDGVLEPDPVHAQTPETGAKARDSVRETRPKGSPPSRKCRNPCSGVFYSGLERTNLSSEARLGVVPGASKCPSPGIRLNPVLGG